MRVKARAAGTNEGGDYIVLHCDGGPRHGEIRGIACAYCSYFDVKRNYKKGNERSGFPVYNRMRAAMVKHLHEHHQHEIGTTCEVEAACVATVEAPK